MKKNHSVMRNNLYFLKLIWDISPKRVLHTFLNSFIDFGMWAFASVVFFQYLFGEEQTRSFREVFIFISCAVVGYVAADLYGFWFRNSHQPKADADIHRSLNLMLFEKAKAMDLACYETPEFYNTYTKAATETTTRAAKVLTNCANMTAAFLSSVYVVISMCSVTWWSLIFIAFPFFSNMYFSKKLSAVEYQLNNEQIPFSRRMDYTDRVVYLRKYAGELRLTNIFSHLEKMFIQAVDSFIKVLDKYAAKKSWIRIIRDWLMYDCSNMGMWCCGGFLAITGRISLSKFILLANAITSVSWMIKDFAEAVAQASTNSMFIENLKNFLNYTPNIDENAGGKMPEQTVEEIKFCNVTFTYPGQDRPALKNVNLTLKKGIKHALVGINGSGKSTLFKLLLRFYDPTEGAIYLNGTDIRELDIKEYRKLIGIAFQDFAMFSASVKENVLLKEVVSEKEAQVADDALKDSDVWEKIVTLEKGSDTILTREFDPKGAELSGGEKQKIAIARAFAKNSPVVLLDEPSSALDPIAEYKMFETINRLCESKEKLSVIVSHRLSSAASCDKIFMFENGTLLEEGSHNELLEQNGAYASMFRKQAENYLVENGGQA